MAWVKHEFECEDCSHEFEELYKRSERDEVECPECESRNLKQLISTPNVASFSLLDQDGRRQSLLKRSAEHTQKLIDKEPEKFKGGAGIARRTKKTQVGYGD